MSNKRKAVAEETGVNEESEYAREIEVLKAQNEALANEVSEVKAALDAERTERQSLQRQLEEFQNSMKASGSSADLKPEPLAKPVRPEVTIGEVRYRFKVAEVRLGRFVVPATNIAADENRLAETFAAYPGLFEKV